MKHLALALKACGAEWRPQYIFWWICFPKQAQLENWSVQQAEKSLQGCFHFLRMKQEIPVNVEVNVTTIVGHYLRAWTVKW